MNIKDRKAEKNKTLDCTAQSFQEISAYTKLKCDVFPPPQVYVHRKVSDNLLNVIPARILPNEYGGEAGPLLDHWGKDLSVLSVPSPQSDRLWIIIFYLNFTYLSLLSIAFPFSFM